MQVLRLRRRRATTLTGSARRWDWRPRETAEVLVKVSENISLVLGTNDQPSNK